ncbi:MAG: MBOAT family protein [Candidatus Omnitrophica bacterium]|nr:MBOAT family protein [Candidatus Omnitrophota bacterium]
MIFNSIQFLCFALVVLTVYHCLKHKFQNIFLLFASYFFYGSWNWHFLALIFLSTCVDYVCGLSIAETQSEKKKKFFLVCSIVVNLGILGFFKYANFFTESLQAVLANFGWQIDAVTLNIVLPVGISFYTFQTMSYSIDVYRGEVKPCRDFLDFALFVSFFPQLVAGPIERASSLLPQIKHPRTLNENQFSEGLCLIVWGYFQKVFVADNLAILVTHVFEKPEAASGMQVLFALYAFAFQLFCDFSGYSDIARGISKCLGFELMVNFRTPYFSKGPAEFWRRWHISLSSWLRDYLYIPLGGNRGSWLKNARNIMITMTLGGLWHGAGLNFVLWGFYHGCIILLYRAVGEVCAPLKFVSELKKMKWFGFLQVIVFFHVFCLGLLFFRVSEFSHIPILLKSLCFNFYFNPAFIRFYGTVFVFHIWLLLLIHAGLGREKEFFDLMRGHPFRRWCTFVLFYYLIFVFGEFGGDPFIYFQF